MKKYEYLFVGGFRHGKTQILPTTPSHVRLSVASKEYIATAITDETPPQEDTNFKVELYRRECLQGRDDRFYIYVHEKYEIDEAIRMLIDLARKL